MGRDKAERFLEHLQPLQRRLEGFCRRMVLTPDDVADVLQTAIAVAYRDFDLYAEGTNFRAWVFAYLHRAIQNANRRLRRDRSAEPLDEVIGAETWEPRHDLPVQRLLLDTPEVVLEHCDAELATGLRQLNPLERSAVLLQAVGEFKYREIAEILEVPIGTVMSALARARHRLREQLTEYGLREGLLRRGDG